MVTMNGGSEARGEVMSPKRMLVMDEDDGGSGCRRRLKQIATAREFKRVRGM